MEMQIRINRFAGRVLLGCSLTLQGLFLSATLAQKSDPDMLDSPSSPPVTVDVDLSRSEKPFTPIYNWFGYDEANY